MTKVRDPVCGMTIEAERAPASGRYGDQTVYFCCARCQQQYESTHAPR